MPLSNSKVYSWRYTGTLGSRMQSPNVTLGFRTQSPDTHHRKVKQGEPQTTEQCSVSDNYRPVCIIDLSISRKNNELLRKFVLVYWTVLMVSVLFYRVLIIREGFYNVVGRVLPIASLFDHAKTISLCANEGGDRSAKTSLPVLYKVEMYWPRFYKVLQ